MVPAMSARRAPRPEDRGSAAEQTRERILDAAMAEFGAKGYSGARTAGIAARAGVNQQLISYYFGGKQGLLDELRNQWAASAAYLDATLDRPDWARLVVWQALGDNPGANDEVTTAERQTRLREAVERIRL